MAFDQAQNAARLAALQQRCNDTYPRSGGRFDLAQSATIRWSGDNPFQTTFAPVSQSRVAVAWSCTYRGVTLRGSLIVVDASQAGLGVAATLEDAERALAGIDMRILRSGGATGALGVRIGENVPRPYYSPGADTIGDGNRVPGGVERKGDGRWVNSPPFPKG